MWTTAPGGHQAGAGRGRSPQLRTRRTRPRRQDDADTAANDAVHRADSLDTVVKGLDNYKQMANVSVNFGFDKAVLTKDDKEQLDGFAAQLGTAKSYILEVTGGTDSTGSAAYNYDLSQRRADAVVQYLAAKYGVAAHRFYLIGIGKDKEVAPEHHGGRPQAKSPRGGAVADQHEQRSGPGAHRKPRRLLPAATKDRERC